jgi:hypothetical protein
MTRDDQMQNAFERVYTVYDWWDGPRAGFADFRGKPQAYRSIWREDVDDWDPDHRFALNPVSPETLECAVEAWEIWKRWEEAYYAGMVELNQHPALPEDRDRHNVLTPIVQRALEIKGDGSVIAIGEFRVVNGARGGQGIPTSRAVMEVRWTDAGEPAAEADNARWTRECL